MQNEQYHLMCKRKSDYSRLLQNPPKLFIESKRRALQQLIAPMLSREMSECEMAIARWMRQKFSSITLAQRMVRKKGEERLYLYLKRQSEGTWMKSKCQIMSK